MQLTYTASYTDQALSAALRVSAYMQRRVVTITDLAAALATIPEAVEMARAVGLTIPQVLYNAQMIRTWSLLLRTAQRRGFTIGGRNDSQPLLESPYLLHPVEKGSLVLETCTALCVWRWLWLCVCTCMYRCVFGVYL